MRVNSCSTCTFWDPHSSRARGLCRRSAPRAHLVGAGTEVAVQALWPETAVSDWCGQYASVDGPPVPVYRLRAGRDPNRRGPPRVAEKDMALG